MRTLVTFFKRRRCFVKITTLFVVCCLAYFCILSLYLSSVIRHEISLQICIQPKLELWHPELRKYFTDPAPLRCSETDENWVITDNGTFRISEKALQKHGNIKCNYTAIERASDFKVKKGETIESMKNGDKLISDVFEVECVGSKIGSNDSEHKQIYLGVALNKEALARKSKPLPSTRSLGIDILMFGFDSVSRMTWMRNLPKAHDYFVSDLGGIVLEGYNVVGDGTPQALLPILTGKNETELPEARRGFANASTVDKHPWIWTDLKKAGYVTQWGEESPGMGTFTYRMLGFKEQPVDHYIRNFYLAAEKEYKRYHPNCFGSQPRHLNMLNWIKEFLKVYSSQRKFSFNFHSEYTHGGYNKLRWADTDLKDFLEHLNINGHLDNALLIMMADHGARFQRLRQSEQGKYEERMPYVGIRIPPSLENRHPETMKNLKINAHRLSTPFDIHATFEDVLDYHESEIGDKRKRGISLFKEIPSDRSCVDAEIEPHWCACLPRIEIPSDDEYARMAAFEMVAAINRLTSSERENCVELSLGSITKAEKLRVNENVLRFKKSADTHGRIPVFSEKMEVVEEFYQLTLVTSPSNALYEGTVRYLVQERKYTISDREISRINVYGRQPHCVMERLPHLRPYCFCKDML